MPDQRERAAGKRTDLLTDRRFTAKSESGDRCIVASGQRSFMRSDASGCAESLNSAERSDDMTFGTYSSENGTFAAAKGLWRDETLDAGDHGRRGPWLQQRMLLV
jgi:hypothetical protein